MKPDIRKAKKTAWLLLKISRETDRIDSVYQSLELVSKLYRLDPLFRSIILTRRLNSNKKRELLEQSLGSKLDPIVSELFEILDEKKESVLLMAIFPIFAKFRSQELKILSSTVFTSEKLSNEEYREIQQSLESSLGQKLEVLYEMDPALVGGIKVRVGNRVLDGSIAGALNRLKTGLTHSRGSFL